MIFKFDLMLLNFLFKFIFWGIILIYCVSVLSERLVFCVWESEGESIM